MCTYRIYLCSNLIIILQGLTNLVLKNVENYYTNFNRINSCYKSSYHFKNTINVRISL